MFEWTVLIAAVACLVSSLTIKHLENRKIWGLEIWKWCLMVAVVFCGRLFSDLTVWLLVFLIERNFLLKKKVLYFVYSLQNSVRICVWSALVLLSWHLVFNRGVTRSQGHRKGPLLCVARPPFVAGWGATLDGEDRSSETPCVVVPHEHTLSGPPTMELAEQVGPSKSGQLSLKSVKKGKDEAGLSTLSNALDESYGIRRLQESLRSMNTWHEDEDAVKAYLDRKSLAHSLNDTKTAINQLHKLASVVAVIVIIIIWLLLMGFATTKVLVLFSSQLLLVGFMFSNTCKTVFEAIVFVFVTHPFDVGDRCVIDGVQMVVEEMNILTTVFLRYDNEKIYYPNALLAMKPISNFYRSPDMGDSIEFSIAVSTSVESIVALKARIKAYLENKPHHWHPKHSIVVKDIVDVNKMNMALYVTHTMNFQNMAEKTNRRSELVFELKKIFEELSIEYHLLPQEVQISYANSMSGPAIIGRP
ncbi:Mechanosensitive ion channel protein 10 [Acorus calamus]|uniref:Mechanosensitive ion channel protein 10 n=1 Tax=Acorus calamus TaxID=4465 RepID=A0AAV9CFP5_ACOCL|nr:Mechanosensitive ion channel protein 10 [Acorus calamus]